MSRQKVSEPRLRPTGIPGTGQGWLASIDAADGKTYEAFGQTTELALANLAYMLAKEVL